jgi:hypothetical protein
VPVELADDVPRDADRLAPSDVEDFEHLRPLARRYAHRGSDRFAQPVLGRACHGLAVDTEDPGHDHLERDRLHRRRQREWAPQRPAFDLALSSVRDHLGVARDSLAVERRQQQPALAHVLGSDERQHRAGAHDRAQRRLAGERRRELRVGGEQRAGMVGVAGDNDVFADRPEHPEGLPQPAPGAEDELDLTHVEAHGLKNARLAHGGRQPHGRAVVGRGTGGGRRRLVDQDGRLGRSGRCGDSGHGTSSHGWY